MAYFSRLADATPHATLLTYGFSPQGRHLRCLVVAKGQEFEPKQAQSSGRAVVLIQNGIHSGEIEGKDASMLLLREILITGEKAHLLENLILLVIPIVNPDGHERSGPANRPNQNGPVEMGWRTTAHNLNLNRDYMKADTPEMKALLTLYAAWNPDFIIDNHTTDGADYQYQVTYGIERHENVDPELRIWGIDRLLPFVLKEVEQRGFLTAPYIDMRGTDLSDGILFDPALPRYSTGYAAVRNRLAILVETHSLKPFGERVHATKAMNEAVLDYLGLHSMELTRANGAADARVVQRYAVEKRSFPLEIELTDEWQPFAFKGFESVEEYSPITGSPVVRYGSHPIEFEIPLFARSEVVRSATLPCAYCIPREFHDLVERIRLHGIELGELEGSLDCAVERYQFLNATFTKTPYEGRTRVNCHLDRFKSRVRLCPGTIVVPTAQRLVGVLAHLLEPGSPDSFVRWGFFNAFFERKEYIEPYVLEPIAREMLERDPVLREDFEQRLEEDEAFRDDPKARLEVFYGRSPFFDAVEKVYPVVRVVDPRSFARLKKLVRSL